MPDYDINQDGEEFASRLGVVLALARKHKGLTQQQAADELGVVADTIGRWEAGANKISAYDLVRLVRLYECDPDIAINPPASRVEIRRRLGPVAAAARRGVRLGLLPPLPPSGDGLA